MAEAPELEEIVMIFKKQALELMGSDLINKLKDNIFLQEGDLVGFTLPVTPAQKARFCQIANGVFSSVEECREAVLQMKARQAHQEGASPTPGPTDLQSLKKKS